MTNYNVQKVQRVLKANEKADKPDASPVTIADYGERQAVCASLGCQKWKVTVAASHSVGNFLMHSSRAGCLGWIT